MVNDAVVNRLRTYIDDFVTLYGFNELVIKAALQYLEETEVTSFNDLVRRAANKYTGVDRIATNDAVLDALRLYTGNSSGSLTGLINIAALQEETV